MKWLALVFGINSLCWFFVSLVTIGLVPLATVAVLCFTVSAWFALLIPLAISMFFILFYLPIIYVADKVGSPEDFVMWSSSFIYDWSKD